jgi:hypothetical protein
MNARLQTDPSLRNSFAQDDKRLEDPSLRKAFAQDDRLAKIYMKNHINHINPRKF